MDPGEALAVQSWEPARAARGRPRKRALEADVGPVACEEASLEDAPLGDEAAGSAVVPAGWYDEDGDFIVPGASSGTAKEDDEDVQVTAVVPAPASSASVSASSLRPSSSSLRPGRIDGRVFNRGAVARRRRGVTLEREIIEECSRMRSEGTAVEDTKHQIEERYTISRASLNTPLRRADSVATRAAEADRRRLRGSARSKRFYPRGSLAALEKRLLQHVQDTRRQLRPVRRPLVQARAREVLEQLAVAGHEARWRGVPFTASRKWALNFFIRSGQAWRRIKNRRPSHDGQLAIALRKFVHMVETHVADDHRWNLDEVPFELDLGAKYGWFEKGAGTCQVPAPAGSGKRFGTLVLLVGLAVESRRPLPGKRVLIFRGQQMRNFAAEFPAYHENVSVYFQRCAWADTATGEEIIKPLAEHMASVAAADGQERFTLYADSLRGHRSWRYVSAVAEKGGTMTFGPAGKSECWQPVGHGLGYLTKVLMGQKQECWLAERWHDDKLNAERWVKGPLTARDRRILVTQWAGEAWRDVCSEGRYVAAIRAAFEATGCAATSNPASRARISTVKLDWTLEPPVLEDEYLDRYLTSRPNFAYSTPEGAEEKDSSTDEDSSTSSDSSSGSGSDHTELDSPSD